MIALVDNKNVAKVRMARKGLRSSVSIMMEQKGADSARGSGSDDADSDSEPCD